MELNFIDRTTPTCYCSTVDKGRHKHNACSCEMVYVRRALAKVFGHIYLYPYRRYLHRSGLI